MHLQGAPQALKVLALPHFVDLSLELVPAENVKHEFVLQFTKSNEEEEEEGALPKAFPSSQRPRALSIGRRCRSNRLAIPVSAIP